MSATCAKGADISWTYTPYPVDQFRAVRSGYEVSERNVRAIVAVTARTQFQLEVDRESGDGMLKPGDVWGMTAVPFELTPCRVGRCFEGSFGPVDLHLSHVIGECPVVGP